MFRIGLGCYPLVTLNDALSSGADAYMVMGVPGNDRLDLARGIRAAKSEAFIGYRFYQPDPQVDLTRPKEEALRWFKLLTGLSGGNSDFVSQRLLELQRLINFFVGDNEPYGNDLTVYDSTIQFELELCRLLQSRGLPYACVKAPPFNIPPEVLVEKFRPLLERAAYIADDNYTRPNATDMDPSTNEDCARRPFAWYKACKAAGVRFPRFVSTEFGTWASWRSYGLDQGKYIALGAEMCRVFDEWQSVGMPIACGPMLYGIGLEGDQGVWNIDGDGLHAMALFNYDRSRQAPVMATIPDPKPWAGKGLWSFYPPSSLPDMAKDLDWVAVKYADGSTYGDQNDSNVFRRTFKSLLPGLKANGTKVLAWVYVYGDDPVGEASVANSAEADGADGLIIDAEYEYVGKVKAADTYFNNLNHNIPVAFTPDFRLLINSQWPWPRFTAECDAVMPQLYFTDFGNSPFETVRLISTYHQMREANAWPNIDLCPIWPGNAYPTDLGTAFQLSIGYSGMSVWQASNIGDLNLKLLKGFNLEGGEVNPDELAIVGEQIWFKASGVPFNPTSALTKAWLKAISDGQYLGRPRGNEFDAGRFRCQEFERGVAWAQIGKWDNIGYELNKAQAS